MLVTSVQSQSTLFFQPENCNAAARLEKFKDLTYITRLLLRDNDELISPRPLNG